LLFVSSLPRGLLLLRFPAFDMWFPRLVTGVTQLSRNL
jgi:hypothetical protein